MCVEERELEHDHEHCKECQWCPTSDCTHSCDTFFEDAYEKGVGTG